MGKPKDHEGIPLGRGAGRKGQGGKAKATAADVTKARKGVKSDGFAAGSRTTRPHAEDGWGGDRSQRD